LTGEEFMAAIRPNKATPKKTPSTARERAARKARAALSVITGGRSGDRPAKAAAPGTASAPPKHPRKPKRTLTPDNVVQTLVNFAVSVPALARGFVKPLTSAALREKVVLGVTSINDCRYCKWGHTHWALANGVSLDEVNQILGHQAEKLKANNPAEVAAILFAQHYAEERDQFDPAAIEGLRQYYDEAQIREIIAYIHAITLGNLTGNTMDAFLGRFQRHGHTGILFEGAIAAAAAPILVAVLLLARLDRNVKMDRIRAR
jgi:AhpD family alkylhydroperoxidase